MREAFDIELWMRQAREGRDVVGHGGSRGGEASLREACAATDPTSWVL